LFDAQMTPDKVGGEVAYLGRSSTGTFERPYGWAWLLMLSAELSRHETDAGRRWYFALRPLADAFAARFAEFLPKATYSIRVGTHFNSAFAMALAFEYSQAVGDQSLEALILRRATEWFGHDADCQAWEPGGDDFLSSALMEAECMRRVMEPEAWRTWLGAF